MKNEKIDVMRKNEKKMKRCNEIEIAGATYYRYQFSILRLCEILHMYTSETLEGYSPEVMYVAYRYLEWRIWDGWIASLYRYDFSTQVRVLVSIALATYKNEAHKGKLANIEQVTQELVFRQLSEALNN